MSLPYAVRAQGRPVAALLLVAILGSLLAATGGPAAAGPDRQAGPAIRREPSRGERPAGPGESTVSLVIRSSATPPAVAASARLAALRPLVSSDADAASRRALLAADRLSDVERARVGELVQAFSTRHGLRVVDEGLGYITVAGPVASLASAFGTTLRSARSAAGTTLGVAAGALAVPRELGSVVAAAHGLDDRPAVRSRAVPFGYEGHHLRTAYRARPGSRNGAGTTVGIIQFSGWNSADLTTYAGAAGISLAPGQITEISVNGANPAQPDAFGGEFEVALDTEAVLAVAPAAKQRVYFTTNNYAGTIGAWSRIAQDAEAGLLTVVSTSWGSCEPRVSAVVTNDIAVLLRRIVAAGATLTAASGDAGGYGCSSADSVDSQLAVDFPASLPEVLGVGGTTLPTISTPGGFAADTSREKAWGVNAGSAPAYQGDGSGGGASVRFARPAYQAGIPIAGTTRLVPDLAALADAQTGLGVYVGSQGGWLTGGGTSLASPIVAAMLAGAASDANRTSGPGDIHSVIYVNQQAFRDISTGVSNAFPATDGYDRVTGLGVPIFEVLAPILGLAPTGPSATPTPSATSASPSPSPTAAPQPPTLVAQTTATAGVLITVFGSAAPGAAVELWGVTAPNGTITRVNTPTVIADSAGNWSKVIRPLRNVNLQARVGSAASSTRFIAVSTAVRQSVAALAGCTVQVAGSVFEPKPGATVFMRAVDSAGRTVSLGSGLVEGDGRFLLRRPYACGQQLAVYTVISGDNVNRPGATSTQSITTRA